MSWGKDLSALRDRLRSDDPIDYATARRIHDALVEEWHMRRDMSLMGYSRSRAESLASVIELIPSSALEIYSAISGGNLARRLWGGRVYAAETAATQEFVGRLLSTPKCNEHMARLWADHLAGAIAMTTIRVSQ